MDDPSIITAIEQVQAGDDSAFEYLREQYAPLLVTTVSKIQAENDEIEFEDLMQEASLALFRAALRFDLSQDRVTFGLYAKICVRNRLISVLRKHRKRDPNVQTAKAPATPAERKSARRAGLGHLSEAVDTLFSEFEKSVYLLYLAGYSVADIAAGLHKSDKSIDNAIYRIRKKIKQYFQKRE